MPKSKRNYDSNGWYTVQDNPIARSGIFEYTGAQISSDLEPDRIYNVWRPESELNNPETIESFSLIPWLPRHAMVGAQGVPVEQVGMQGMTGTDVYFDTATKELKCTIKAMGANLSAMIDELDIKDLSIGMTCDWIIVGGTTPEGQPYDVMQTNIMANHLASVPVGRAGAGVAVMDSANVLSFAMDELDFKQTEKTDEEPPMKIEDMKKAYDALSPDDKAKYKAMLGGAKKEEGDAKDAEPEEEKDKDPEKDAPKAAMDSGVAMDAAAIEAMIDSKVAEAKKGFALDEKAVAKAINDKNTMVSKLEPIVGAFDHAAMDLQGVAEYALKHEKISIACDSGEAVATLKGFLHNHKQPTLIRDAIAQDGVTVTESQTSKDMGL